MTSFKLTTQLWIKALIRRCQIEAVPAVVVKKGFEQSGSILLKVNLLDGTARIYSPMTGPDGGRHWYQPMGDEPKPESDVDAYIARQKDWDSDIWVVEIEDRQGRHFLDEPVDKTR